MVKAEAYCTEIKAKKKWVPKQCVHKREKRRCKEAECIDKATGICAHYLVKETCKDCIGSAICEHKRRKSKCKEGDCKGNGTCAHSSNKYTCKHC